MRCAQIDSFPQNPAEPIPAGRPYSMLAHRRTVRDNGLSAVPCIRPLPCLALPRPALPRPAQPGHGCFRILPANVMRWRWDTKIVVSSFVAGLSRNPCCRPVAFPRLCSARRPYAACLHITPFPAVACFPAPVGLRLAVLGTCWGFLRSVSAFSGQLPLHSHSPFVVK